MTATGSPRSLAGAGNNYVGSRQLGMRPTNQSAFGFNDLVPALTRLRSRYLPAQPWCDFFLRNRMRSGLYRHWEAKRTSEICA